jgi:hypothetical protein
MPTHHDTKGKVLVIVEEVVQRAFLLDPDDADTVLKLNTLRGLLRGAIVDPGEIAFGRNRPPRLLDHRAKKGAGVVRDRLLLDVELQDAEWERFTGLTVVYPDEDGNPRMEVKCTNNGVKHKPVTK